MAPATSAAEHKLITGFFDNISKENTKHYLDEIFEICHLKFEDEPYLINFNKTLAAKWSSIKQNANGKKMCIIINLNVTGKKFFSKEKFELIELVVKIQKHVDNFHKNSQTMALLNKEGI